MILTRRPGKWLGGLLSASVAAFSSVAMAAMGSDVASVKVSPADGVTIIEVTFSCPNRFLDNGPQGLSDSLQINLLRSEQCRSVPMTAGVYEIARPGNAAQASLTLIEYEALFEDEAVLRIRFNRPVESRLAISGDQRKLTITLSDDHALTSGALSPTLLASTAEFAEDESDGAKHSGAGVAVGDKPMSDTQLEALMGEGEAVFLAGNYSRAIQVYTRVLRAPENAFTPKALELLGLSRERNGQVAQAVSEYRRYLDHYPDQEGAARVGQRLAGLQTAHKTPANGRNGDKPGSQASPWDVYGGISQYYRRDTINLDGQSAFTAQSSILTNADLVLRRQGERMDFTGRATLGNFWDLLSGDRGPGNQTRLYQGYVDLADRVSGVSGRLGRQTLRKMGVLGRFDGAHLAWEFKPGMSVNFMGGYPVATTKDGIKTGRNFYGAAMDFEDVAELVDVSFFYNKQNIDGLDNREAIGTELRYFDDSKSLITLIDYDIGYKKLNTLLFLGNWKATDTLTLSGSIDHRTSPYLTTRNALIGQQADSIDELLEIYSGDEIRDLAEDRSGKVTAYRFGASQSLSERFQLNADFTMTNFDGSAASQALPGYPDQDTQYYYSLSLVGSRLFMEGDSYIVGVRHIDGGNTSTTTLYLDSRFRLSSKLMLNPRLRYSHRNTKLYDADSDITSPSFRFVYRIGRRWRLDFESGIQWVNQKSVSNNGDRSSWFLYFGYRADF